LQRIRRVLQKYNIQVPAKFQVFGAKTVQQTEDPICYREDHCNAASANQEHEYKCYAKRIFENSLNTE
jgi:hypothetical protein